MKIIQETLEAAPTLSYVNDFPIGGAEELKLLFPFICVGYVDANVEALSIGPLGNDEIEFSVTIWFGQKSIIPEEAYFGTDTDKGLLHMVDDIRDVLRAETFGGNITRPARVTQIRTYAKTTSGGWVWVGRMTLVCRRKEARLR